MKWSLPCVLVIGLAASVGCNRQQPATPAAPQDNTGDPTPSTKQPSGDPVTAPGQPGGKIPKLVQQPIASIPPVVQGLIIELGESEQRPVLFFELRTGMVIRVSDIKYDKLGWVDSYAARVQLDKVDEAKVLVRTETPPAGGSEPIFAAAANGKPVPRQSNMKLVGFSVKDMSGVVLARGGAGRLNMQTKFSYDSTGRQDGSEQIAHQDGKTLAINTKFSYGSTGRQCLAQQDVQHEGKMFAISYSDYRWDESGRLIGFTAQVVKAE